MIKMPDDEHTIRNCVFAFKCTAKWDELTPTNDDKIHFCKDCQKEVFLCEDDEELVRSVRLNRCIAIYREDDVGRTHMLMGDVIFKS